MKQEVLVISKALGDESRLRILMCLEGTTLCLCQLTEILGLASSTVSQHVGVLIEAGLLESRQQGRWHYYRWPNSPGSACIADALAWLRMRTQDDRQFKADAAKRAVVMRNSDIPCPEEAKARVLFLCTGNSCRSQMAEAMLREYAGGRFEVYSAGLQPKPIHKMVYTVMNELGIDVRHQEPTSIMEFLGKFHFGYLITVCPHAEVKCPVFPGIGVRLYWPTKDPANAVGSQESRLGAFRKARDELRGRILGWLDEQGVAVDDIDRKEV